MPANLTRRCVYCRPTWTYGIRPASLLGRIIARLWPPHIMGHDYGPPCTDGACWRGLRRHEAEIRRIEDAAWAARRAKWEGIADKFADRRRFHTWLRFYQAARRVTV